MSSRTTRLTFHCLAIVLLVVSSGCGSSTLPPPLTSAQRDELARLHFDGVTVGVEPFADRVYSDRLIRALRATQLFDRVAAVDAFCEQPTLVARVRRRIYGRAVVPLLTGLTLGIIPTTLTEEFGYDFSLISSAVPSAEVRVQFSHDASTTLGWSAMYLSVLPDHTIQDLYGHRRFIQRLAWKIAEHRTWISTAAAPADPVQCPASTKARR